MFKARRSKFWLVMYSSACQRVQRLTRLPTLALPATAPTLGIGNAGPGARSRPRDHRVGINADVNLFIHMLQPEIERFRLSGVGFRQDHQAGPTPAPRGTCGPRSRKRFVARAVVDHDHAQIRVIRVKHRPDGSRDHLLLVVCRDQYGNLAGGNPPPRDTACACASDR